MTSPSDYAVHGPDGHQEITQPVPVSQSDDRFSKRQSGGVRRRKPRRDGAKGEPAAPRDGDPEPPPPEDEDHIVDTLA